MNFVIGIYSTEFKEIQFINVSLQHTAQCIVPLITTNK